jgi:hypothetical protein
MISKDTVQIVQGIPNPCVEIECPIMLLFCRKCRHWVLYHSDVSYQSEDVLVCDVCGDKTPASWTRTWHKLDSGVIPAKEEREEISRMGV